MNDVPFIKQEEPNECGVAALTSIASYYLRRKVDYGEILRLCHILTGGSKKTHKKGLLLIDYLLILH